MSKPEDVKYGIIDFEAKLAKHPFTGDLVDHSLLPPTDLATELEHWPAPESAKRLFIYEPDGVSEFLVKVQRHSESQMKSWEVNCDSFGIHIYILYPCSDGMMGRWKSIGGLKDEYNRPSTPTPSIRSLLASLQSPLSPLPPTE